MGAPIEKKVKAATAVSYLSATAGLAVLQAVNDTPLLVSALPNWVEPIVLGVVPAALTFLAGWQAKHTHRTDPEG